ncbi:MAG: DMT family transporter [Mogibacterium sp.]|nr:DMT family transporter [Mogibacterium sp.]
MKKVIVCIITTAFLFATMEVALKIGGANFDSFQLTFLRFLIGGLMLLPSGIKEYQERKTANGGVAYMSGHDWLWLLLCGIMCIPVSMVLFQIGVLRCNAATAASIMCLNPIFTMVLAHIFTSEKMSRPKYYAVGIALTACVFLMRPWDIQEGNTPLGLAIMLASSISFAAYTVMGKRTLAKVGTYTQTSISFILGALVLLLIILVTGRPVLAGVAEHPLTVAYVGIMITGVGYLCYFLAIRYSDATTGSIAFFIKPGIAPFLAVIILHETIAWNTIVGILLLFLASFITIRDTRKAQAKTA